MHFHKIRSFFKCMAGRWHPTGNRPTEHPGHLPCRLLSPRSRTAGADVEMRQGIDYNTVAGEAHDGTKLRGFSKNKICIGVATDKTNTVIIAEGYGKPSQKMSHDSFMSHMEPHSTLVHDEESTHKKLVKDLDLVSDAYSSKELKGLEEIDNPLDPVNHTHYLVKRFLYAHGGFKRSQVQSYLNLYSFTLNPPVTNWRRWTLCCDAMCFPFLVDL